MPGAARALPRSPGEAVSRFRDDVTAVARFVAWVADPIGQVVMVAVAVAVLAAVNPLLTVGVFVPLAAVVLLIRWASERVAQYRRANQEAIGGVTDLLGEIFGAVNAVKVAGAENQVVHHLRVRNEARRKAMLADTLFNQVFGPFESVVEMNSSRLFVAQQTFRVHRAEYEAIFGPMPPLDDTS